MNHNGKDMDLSIRKSGFEKEGDWTIKTRDQSFLRGST